MHKLSTKKKKNLVRSNGNADNKVRKVNDTFIQKKKEEEDMRLSTLGFFKNLVNYHLNQMP